MSKQMYTNTQRPLGRTGLEVSTLGFGAAPLANLYRDISESQAVATVQAALEQGITYFDTAPLYGRGLSEKRLGVAMAGVARSRYVLSTKIGRLVQDDGSLVWDFSRDGVLRSLEESLARLRCESIDIVHIHDPDSGPGYYRQAMDEAYPALDDLRRQGVIRAVSVGINQWQMLMDFARDGEFDCFMLAGRYTLLEQGALPLLDLCAEREIGILLAGVFNSGILASGARPGAKYNYRDAPAEMMDKTRHLEEVCARHGVSLRAAALQFPLGHPAISSLVIGCSAPQRIADNLELLETAIPVELWRELFPDTANHAKSQQ